MGTLGNVLDLVVTYDLNTMRIVLDVSTRYMDAEVRACRRSTQEMEYEERELLDEKEGKCV